ncbi:universal stress protein [Streptomyces sp. NPDC051921]|uniref:universal stress protein n=1 Tax=Streptomyces sp. NPDC051921 TaxID=3155806 RepID=UPI0034353E06
MTRTTARHDIAVGIDPVKNWHLPLAWSVDEAHLRGVRLRLVVAVTPQHDTPDVDDTPRHLARRQAGMRALRAAFGWARSRRPGVEAVETLATAAEHALAVVVGRRGRGGYTGMGVGSVVHGLLHRAHCPMITVPAG